VAIGQFARHSAFDWKDGGGTTESPKPVYWPPGRDLKPGTPA